MGLSIKFGMFEVVVYCPRQYTTMDSPTPVCSKRQSESVEEKELPPWAELPYLALTNIFVFLDRKDALSASTVCKNWRSTYFQPRFWSSLTIPFGPSKLEQAGFLSRVFGENIRQLRLLLNFSSEPCLQEFKELVHILSKNNKFKKLSIVKGPYAFGKRSRRSRQQGLPSYIDEDILAKLKEIILHLDEFDISCVRELPHNWIDCLLLGLNPSVKSLGLTSRKSSKFSEITLDPTLLHRFQNLQVLTIDYTLLSAELSEVLCQMKSLKKVMVHIKKNMTMVSCSVFTVAAHELRSNSTIIVQFKSNLDD